MNVEIGVYVCGARGPMEIRDLKCNPKDGHDSQENA